MNAAPDSVTALKALWNYKKRGDGSIIITGYKGNNTEITVPAKIGKSEVKAIGKCAFSPNAPRITPETRKIRAAITSITLPESVCVIGEGAFSYCLGLRSVNIPDGVSEIAENTFFNCSYLEKIEIPGSVRTIGSKAFLRCRALKTAVIPEGVTEIVRNAFHECSSLKTIELPRSLISVKRSAAYNFGAVVIVPHGSYAEEYCKRRKLNYICKEDNLIDGK